MSYREGGLLKSRMAVTFFCRRSPDAKTATSKPAAVLVILERDLYSATLTHSGAIFLYIGNAAALSEADANTQIRASELDVGTDVVDVVKL